LSDSSTLLIIGIGNSLRRDDGAGLILATALAARWQNQGRHSRLLLETQLGPEMALELAAADVSAVLFIDAAADLDRPVSFTRLAREDSSPGLTHHLSPSALLLYAGSLFASHPPAWLLCVQGVDFGLGEELSPAATRAVAAALHAAESWWTELTAPTG
jgi:hydrogenase maturation protease